MRVVFKEEYIRNSAYILPYCENIRNADITELAELGEIISRRCEEWD